MYLYFRLLFLTKKNRKVELAKLKETKFNYGNDHPDLTFFVIGVDQGWNGLFAIIANQLTHIAYAIERGYVPIIDLKNHKNQYLSEQQSADINTWELYFDQPYEFGLEDIIQAKKVIKSRNFAEPPDTKYRITYAKTIHNQDDIKYWSAIMKKYVRFNSQTKEFLQSKFNKLTHNRGRVLGVHCRGTDYITLKPKNHPIQPDPIDVINKVKKLLIDWNCDSVYLATEDDDIYTLFQNAFGDVLIYDNVKRWKKSDLMKDQSNATLFSSQEDKFNEGLKYLSQIYFLSKCNCFIAGSTRGSLGVLLMSEGFENYYIYNLGTY
jgi:hypothetical protein